MATLRDPAPDPDEATDDLGYDDGVRHAHDFLTGKSDKNPFQGRTGLKDLANAKPIAGAIASAADPSQAPVPPIGQAAVQTPLTALPRVAAPSNGAIAPTPGVDQSPTTPVGATRAVTTPDSPPTVTPPSPTLTRATGTPPKPLMPTTRALPRPRAQQAITKPLDKNFFRR